MKRFAKKELKSILKYEKQLYIGSFRNHIMMKFYNDERYLIWKYLVYLRNEEYYRKNKSFVCKIIACIYSSIKNRLGNKIDIKIIPYYAGKGINIHHKGIIVNGYLGEDCILHGKNCIGNNSMGKEGSLDIPTLGNRVDIGIGANIIGGVHIADGIKVGANAVVTKSFSEKI